MICTEEEETAGNARPLHQKSNGSKPHDKSVPPKKKSVKRSRAESGAENGVDNGAKKRGRPRVDTGDETAAEVRAQFSFPHYLRTIRIGPMHFRLAFADKAYSQRRRTQIRLAQRAYRLRKEGVISSLNRRVADLEKTVDDMSQTFLAFNDEAMGSDVLVDQPDLARQLRHATERFLALAKVANPETAHGDDISDNDIDMPGTKHSTPSSNEPHQDRPAPPAASPTMNPGAVHALVRPAHPNPDSSMKRIDNASVSTPALPFHPDHGWSFLDSMFASGLNMFQIQSPPYLHAPHSISSLTPSTCAFSQTTFARRIHRRCLERGYSILTDPSYPLPSLNGNFKFSFQFANRSQLVNVFYYLLQKSVDEPLEFWNKPYYTIGGAGTHFPRKDEFGFAVYPPNLHTPEKALRILSPDLSEGAGPHRRVEDAIEAAGFGGQWFDCNDVEGYLSSKGISLDGSSSYIELPASSSLFPHPAYTAPTSSTTADTFSNNSTQLTTSTTTNSHMDVVSDPASLSYQLLPSCLYSSQNQPGAQALNLLGINRETLSDIGNYGNLMQPQNSSTTGALSNRTAVMDVGHFVDGKDSRPNFCPTFSFSLLHAHCYPPFIKQVKNMS